MRQSQMYVWREGDSGGSMGKWIRCESWNEDEGVFGKEQVDD